MGRHPGDAGERWDQAVAQDDGGGEGDEDGHPAQARRGLLMDLARARRVQDTRVLFILGDVVLLRPQHVIRPEILHFTLRPAHSGKAARVWPLGHEKYTGITRLG